MPIDVVERTLDGMAAVKLNVLHWHLSDDQGFRVESKKYPKLHELGSDGNYYTQDQVREVLDYARDRGIRVIPEFDMPGHSTSWFVGYPELASAPGPYQIERTWGVFDPAMDPTRESTYKFLDGFIGEMAKLFPDAYFHIGGDEVNGKQWSANKQIKKFMLDHQIKDDRDLQTYFSTRLLRIVEKHHKIMVGWDEVLHPGLPKNVVVQSWRGQQALAAAARQGYRGLLSNGYYLDLMFPAADHYAVDPLGGDAAALTDEERKRILGGEACMWAEFVTPENVDSRIWPRAAAVAERLWSQQPQDLASLYARLSLLSEHLTIIGLMQQTNPRKMLQRIAGESDVQPLQTLASVLEPVKEYARGQTGPYTQATPLNRLIDAIPPESLAARDFSIRVKRLVSHTSNTEDESAIRTSLMTWRDNDQKFVSANYQSFLAQELFPVSAQLSQIAAVGLQAVDVLTGKATAISDCDAKRASVQQATQATPDLLNQVAPPILDMLTQACTTSRQ
jgi:hexosaminidase